MISLNLKFSKLDQFKNLVFSVKDGDEYGSYEYLKALQKKIQDKYPMAMGPIYINDEFKYATLRCSKSLYQFKPRNVYEIKFKLVHKILDDGRVYVNAYIKKSKMVAKAADFDVGEDITDIVVPPIVKLHN